MWDYNSQHAVLRGGRGAAPWCHGLSVSVCESQFLFSLFKDLVLLRDELLLQSTNGNERERELERSRMHLELTKGLKC